MTKKINDKILRTKIEKFTWWIDFKSRTLFDVTLRINMIIKIDQTSLKLLTAWLILELFVRFITSLIYIKRRRSFRIHCLILLTSNDVKLFLTDDASLATRCPARLNLIKNKVEQHSTKWKINLQQSEVFLLLFELVQLMDLLPRKQT